MAAVDIGASSAVAFMVRLYQAMTMPKVVDFKVLQKQRNQTSCRKRLSQISNGSKGAG
jgi:hypothetical protein